ncbi:MAG: MFS transporter [Myxococcota bacterium]
MHPSEDFAGPRRRVATTALAILVAVNVMSQLDRQIMNVLLPKVQLDLRLSDAQSGWLAGFAFAICYSIAGLPLARFADRGSRSGLITVALAVWSAMTAACGLARSFVELFVARIGVGIGEAGCAPAAHSLISDHFPRHHRGRALATYQLGVPAGILLGSIIGGTLSDHLSWRAVFFLFGVPGIALALVVRAVLKEPVRGGFEGHGDPGVEPVGEIVRFFGRRPAMRQILVAATLHTLAVGAQVTFNFTFLTRVHDLTGTQAGIVIGLLTGIFGGVGTYLGGWLGDRSGARDARWYLWWIAIGALASIPFSLTAYLVPSTPVAIVTLSISVVGSYFYTGACHVIAQSLARPRMRAITASIMLFSMNLLGYGLGPPIAGAISDALGGDDALRYALAAMNAVLVWACVHYALAARTYREDLRAEAGIGAAPIPS